MTKSMITLAQMSDLHLGSKGWTPLRYWNVKRGLGSLNWHRARRFVHRHDVVERLTADLVEQAPDHIAVTGDLVNIGLPREFQAVTQWLRVLGPGPQVSVIPGNHDIYSRLPDHDMCHQFWASNMRSDDFGATVRQGVADGQDYPFVRKVGDVAMIGVNSARPTRPFVAAGRVGRSQLAALETILEALGRLDLARVVLIHHPPLVGLTSRWRALEDADALTEVLRRAGAELVLHGHNHHETLHWTRGPASQIPVCGAASASAGRRHKLEPLGRYYLYCLTNCDAGWQIEQVVRGLTDDGLDVREHSRQVLAYG